ncbi:MAG: hypothetical protein RLZZ444_4423 [Pseudomonadota bacterium]|jgi:hypothetical protein
MKQASCQIGEGRNWSVTHVPNATLPMSRNCGMLFTSNNKHVDGEHEEGILHG